jgi:Na+-driven multidrug efflux pump
VALVLFNVAGTAVLGWYVLSGRNAARLRFVWLRWSHIASIFSVGAWSSISSVQTNVIIALATALAASIAGADAVAGYGTGARLEYLLIPLVFGLGAPLVAMVGTNIGAGQRDRALRAAWIGAAIAFGLTEAIGLAAAAMPLAWLSLFDTDPAMLAAGASYLRIVGPFYGLFGLGMALYFASQGAGRLRWPLVAGVSRLIVAAGGGALALYASGGLNDVFAALALGLAVFGAINAAAVACGAWFGPLRRPALHASGNGGS